MYFRVYCNQLEIEAPDKETAEQILRDSFEGYNLAASCHGNSCGAFGESEIGKA